MHYGFCRSFPAITIKPTLRFDRDHMRDSFRYQGSGDLVWLPRVVDEYHSNPGIVASFNKRCAGKVVGTMNTKTGYRDTAFCGRPWRVHRLVWIWHHDRIESGMVIDHVNGLRDDNRIENLRMVTPQENFNNVHRGPIYDHRNEKWKVQSNRKGHDLHVGYFDDEAEAWAAWKRQAHA